MLFGTIQIEELWQSGTLQYKLGRPAPALDPVPFNSDQQSKVKEKHAAPREPKAMGKKKEQQPLSQQSDQDRRPLSASKSTTKEDERSSKTSNGKIKAKVNGVNSTSQGTSERRKDNSKEPIVVIDDSSSSHPLANDAKQSSRLQLNSREDSPLYEEHRRSIREENAEKDTRYGDTDGGKKKRRSRLDEFARVAPKTFIVDDSASEEEDDIESLEEGEIKEPRSMKKRKTGKVDDAKRRKKREYWENKGNAVGRSISISDDESV
jgi:non-canonical poly(A) RNA polymerase PAPD5/7